LILDGRVSVDGRIIRRLGEKADPARNEIRVDGERLKLQHKVYVLLNKPRGPITSVTDPLRRQVVLDLVKDVKESLRPVGRLDADSEGLLLLTNDGELAYRLTHPRWGVEKVYHAALDKRPNSAALRKLREGVELEEGITAPAKAGMLVRAGGRPTLEIIIHTGWRRQVRRMLAAVGCKVVALQRVRFGPLQLGNLPKGKWRRLNPAEVNELWKAVEMQVKRQPATAGKK
jgi:pseudouridine synthase